MRRGLTTVFWMAGTLVLPMAKLGAVGYAPPVTMSIRMPDGQTKELTAPESGLVTYKLKDGTEYGFRPTMEDDKGTRVTVTIFKINPPDSELGEVETGVGKPATASKTSPVFRITVTKVQAENAEGLPTSK